MTEEGGEEKVSSLKQIRTFQGDVAEALKHQQESLVSIQRAEHEKRGFRQPEGVTEARVKTKTERLLLIVGSFVLVALGSVGAWYAYATFVEKSRAPLVEAPANRFIAVNASEELIVATTTRATLINDLWTATESAKEGELKQIVLQKPVLEGVELLPTSEFFQKIESAAPGNLVRALDPHFMIGAIGGKEGAVPKSVFLIFKLVSFENAFAGMLAWEGSAAYDIGPLFGTAPLLAELPASATFNDLVDRNKDIRTLSNDTQPILLYSFFDTDTLIITDSLETMRSLVERLNREKLSR